MAATSTPPAFRVVHGVIKVCAIIVGFAITTLGLMSVLNLVTKNGWIQGSVAIVVALAAPLAIADRFLPKDDEVAVPGLVSDVVAVVLLGAALIFVGVARPLFVRSGDRFASAGSTTLARFSFLLGGVTAKVEDTPTVASTAPSTSTSTSASSAAPMVAPSSSVPHPERTPAEIFKEWAPSVVSVKVKHGQFMGGGTAFFVNSDGTLATNHHVIDGATDVRVKLMSGKVIDEVELLLDDKENDLALLKVSPSEVKDLKPVFLGDSGGITVGERAISIGNPLGLEHTLTDGLVSSRRVFEGQNYIQMSVPVSPGNSGGPVFNIRAEVIGVTVAVVGMGMAQNLNLAIPINTLKTQITGDYPKRRKFGKEEMPGSW